MDFYVTIRIPVDMLLLWSVQNCLCISS